MRRLAILGLLLACSGSAHVGSPDIYLDGVAGPYKLFVTIRPPQVIPGVAEILVRSQTPGVTRMTAVPLPLFGPGADHPPIPDTLVHSAADPQFFTGALWLMSDGSWQVRIAASGAQGAGTLAIPVPAIAQTTRRMEWPLGVGLGILGLFLVGGLAAICGATVREAKLDADAPPADFRTRQGRIAAAVALAIIAAVLVAGKLWWDSESNIYQQRVYKPLEMRAELQGSDLSLNLSEPGWMQPTRGRKVNALNRVLFVRKMDDLVLDHNHLMHLYAIRQPGLDVIYHLHPDQLQPDEFHVALPVMPPGDYKLYADIVHENGLPETLVSRIHLPNGIPAPARPLSGDDASAATRPVTAAPLLGDTFLLPDGYRMRWLHAGYAFQFELLTPQGKLPNDMALYMGMVGHAAFVKTDGTVFAHIHPNGTVSMAALMLAQPDMRMMEETTIPNTVSFPYGLPAPGAYRIFVQMKHGETIETAAFDTVARTTAQPVAAR